jgi:hypothetical protein
MVILASPHDMLDAIAQTIVRPERAEGIRMFGWFRPSCPCDPSAKRWVEERLQWLAKQFGLHILLERPIVLPTSEYFPDAWDGSAKAGRRMFHRVCGYMNVDPDSVEARFIGKTRQDPFGGGVAAGTWSSGEGIWNKGVVRLEKDLLDRPMDLVGVMAHELSHQLLIGQERIDPDCFDNELLTDLTAVFHGFGVFLANNPRKSTGRLAHWPGTRLYMPEYLSEPMLGYAMAHLAWFRDEAKPSWAKALRWAPRAVFKEGLRYLQETADSMFQPVRLRRGREEQD